MWDAQTLLAERFRSIHSRVGRPSCVTSPKVWRWEYPLACGATRARAITVMPAVGVSTRVWGDPCPNRWNTKDRKRREAMEGFGSHHAHGYAGLAVDSFKPDTTCMAAA